MTKKAVKLAAWIAVGTAIGGCVLPRTLFRNLSNETWPPLWMQAGQWFLVGFLTALLVLILVYGIKERLRKSKRCSPSAIGSEAAAGAKAVRALFESRLPADVDWRQVNDFLRTTKFYKQLLLDRWRESDAFIEYPVADTTIACLGCLHADLAGCYQGTFAFDENGQEDRHEEYRLLNEYLHSKYERIDADLLNLIYLHYLQEDDSFRFASYDAMTLLLPDAAHYCSPCIIPISAVLLFQENVISNNRLERVGGYISTDCLVRVGSESFPVGVAGMMVHIAVKISGGRT